MCANEPPLKWRRFVPLADYFQVHPLDESEWDGTYERRDRVTIPLRHHFARNAEFVRPDLDDAIAAIVNGHGIYALASNEDKKILYIGRAGGIGERISSRIWKHRVKLTGSNCGAGVHHPRKWREYALERRMRRVPDSLDDVQVAVLSTPREMAANGLEACCYALFRQRIGYDPRLNDPARLSGEHATVVLELPDNIATYA
jgi:hypothetical protein